MIKNKSQFLYTNIVYYVSHLHKFICRFSHFQHIQIASIRNKSIKSVLLPR